MKSLVCLVSVLTIAGMMNAAHLLRNLNGVGIIELMVLTENMTPPTFKVDRLHLKTILMLNGRLGEDLLTPMRLIQRRLAMVISLARIPVKLIAVITLR
ncbi:MAG: hypothetical protein ACYSPI_11395 [Planctomycetota bacterium]|jgi:hypothetical protein